MNKNTVLITCARALTPYLSKELSLLGYEIESEHETGVVIKATWYDCMALNLKLRTAFNVLWLVKEFLCDDPIILYRKIYDIDWEDIIPNDEYLSVVSRVDNPSVNNTMFVNQKIKDAIVDRIKDKTGERPNSGPNRKNVVINFYWKDDSCWIYINTSGQKLSDRNYRKMPMSAPLQETLAAGIIAATEYDGSVPFVNPMCGSGTLAIEAALSALKRAPGLLRSNFGFMHTSMYQEDDWYELRKKLQKEGEKELFAPIIATDINPQAVKAAQRNAETAGVAHLIDFKICAMEQTPIPEGNGIIVINPEYGYRMGVIDELRPLYTAIGDFFKQKCTNYDAYVFTGNMDLGRTIRLRTSRKIIFFNADIECRLLKYQMYQGTKRKFD